MSEYLKYIVADESTLQFAQIFGYSNSIHLHEERVKDTRCKKRTTHDVIYEPLFYSIFGTRLIGSNCVLYLTKYTFF